jgi:hypothetical protein
MTNIQGAFVIIFIAINILISIKGFLESYKKGNSYGLALQLGLLGIFVWGDAIIFGAFWGMVGAAVLILNDWVLFLLIYSVFWVVRSLGETIYWFNQQFTSKKSDPSTLPFYKFVKNDSIWFIYQIFYQCVTVISIITSLYLAKLWLSGL